MDIAKELSRIAKMVEMADVKSEIDGARKALSAIHKFLDKKETELGLASLKSRDSIIEQAYAKISNIREALEDAVDYTK